MQIDDKRLLSFREAAMYLGISEAALRKRRFLGQLKGLIRLGGRLYFDKSKLDKFIDKLEIRKREPRDD
jgi:hypothetical protein